MIDSTINHHQTERLKTKTGSTKDETACVFITVSCQLYRI